MTPFPFASLESLTRADADAAARMRRVARAYVKLDAVAAALASILDERVELLTRRIRRAVPQAETDAVGVLLAPPGTPASASRILVETSGALAAQMTARALRQKTPRMTDAAQATSPPIAGAVAAIVSAAARRAHADSTLVVLAAGPATTLARDFAATEPNATTAWLTAIVGADAFDVRVTISGAAMPTAATFSRDALAALGDTPLALPIVAATTLASRADLAALDHGDAFVPTTFSVRAHADRLVGRVALVAPTAERGLAADLAEDGRLVLREGLESFPLDAPTATVTAVEEAPVVVRVELGVVEMKAREWADLGPGDVVTLGRKVGDPAILRVGGVEVARGELCLVDGEYAVKILGGAR